MNNFALHLASRGEFARAESACAREGDILNRPLVLNPAGGLFNTNSRPSQRACGVDAANYQKFVTLWANADPEVQPLVEEARLRLKRMANVER